MDLLNDKENLQLIIDGLKKSREFYKKRLKEEHLYYDEFLSDKIYQIDKLLEQLTDIGMDYIY